MTQRSVTGFRPEDFIPFLDDRPFCTDADINRVTAAAGVLPDRRAPKAGEHKPLSVSQRKALASLLKKATRRWSFRLPVEKYPTWRQQAAEFARIESAAKRLLDALHATKDGDISEMPFALRQAGLQLQAGRKAPDGGSLGDSVLGVACLYRWARAARERAEAGAQKGGPSPRAADEALSALYLELVGIWTKVFERKISTMAGGPLVQFLRACLEPLKPLDPQNINLSDNAIRERMRVLFRDKGIRDMVKSRRKKF